MTDADKVTNTKHFRRDPADVRILINPKIRIRVPGHFWPVDISEFSVLADFLQSCPRSLTRPNPTHQLSDPAQPNLTDRKSKNMDPTQPDTTNSKTVGSQWSSIVTMAVFCTVFEIKRDIGQNNASFSYPLVFNLHGTLQLYVV